MTTDEKLKTQNSINHYLESQEHYQIVLLDMLRCKELSQEEYDKVRLQFHTKEHTENIH